ncbi:metal-dependent hydrolase [Paenibacillus psychroresistens]|uniref:Metal-dependent hydrolase n=1 Tax=Paenibacillus psychroresistens TaxID=1778678 RepID=A0A6B8RH69_9BACL|nr:metal-dependent hydrolase [Paenibacillus psychroresistens]QGQ94736.1 metal-dependent hydrolase [Paenibacillus psychroresistens]
MDTGSHLLMGATLAGLAFIDPAVAAHPQLAQTILFASLLGSHAPDLDAVARIKSYSSYIRNHRGITHSLPALFIWPALVSLIMGLIFGTLDQFAHLYFWSFVAVTLHVLLDLFNAYGVQCFRPLSKKWFHLDVLSIYEPFFFVIHLTGLALWIMTSLNPVPIFIAVYLLTFLYILVRSVHHSIVVKRVHLKMNQVGIYHVIPSLHWFRWQFVFESDSFFYTGKVDYKKVVVVDIYHKDRANPVIEATMGTDGVRAFLHFTQHIHVYFTKKTDGYEVNWRDMRFWHNHKLPFGVDVQLDENLNVVGQSMGWSKKTWEAPYV